MNIGGYDYKVMSF